MCDGSWHRMLFTVKKRDESGNVTHVLCTVRSISDSKRREENLNFAAEAAKREAEMKTRFLATMSQDIINNRFFGRVGICYCRWILRDQSHKEYRTWFHVSGS